MLDHRTEVLLLIAFVDLTRFAAQSQQVSDAELAVKAHFGSAIAGPFGAAGDKCFDVIGRAVNATAMLKSTGVTLSEAAFRKLSPKLRGRFRAQRPAVTYVCSEEAQESR
jgi:class 3 adenylate cyclase